MDPDTEELLLGSVEAVVNAVRKDGVHPTKALVKVSGDRQLVPAHVRLVANAYNTGASNHHRENSRSLFDKAASIPLADADAALTELYPSEVKSAASVEYENTPSEEYELTPHWLKTARKAESVITGTPDAELFGLTPPPVKVATDVRDVYRRAEQLRVEMERHERELHGQAVRAAEKFASLIYRIGEYVRPRGESCLRDVWVNGSERIGPAVDPIMRKVAEEALTPREANPFLRKQVTIPTEKSASWLVSTPYERDATPYVELAAAVEAAGEYSTTMDRLREFSFKAAEANRRFRDTVNPPPEWAPDPTLSILQRSEGRKRSAVKSANLAGADLAGAINLGLGTSIGNSIFGKLGPTDQSGLEGKALLQLMDPKHESSLRAVRARANLAAVMSSPFFKGEDQNSVIDLYNQVSKLSPRVTEHPILLEAAMRQHAAQGGSGVHDLSQLVDIERGLKGRDEMPRADSLKVPTPGSIMGTTGGPPKERH